MAMVAPSPPSVVPVPRERVELILGHVDRLPTLPPVAAKLLSVVSSEASSAQDVARILRLDASLTTGILRMLRRADLGVRNDRVTIDQAVALLGLRAVRNAVLSEQVFSVFSGRGEDVDPETRKGLWRHNLAVACAAEGLAERLNDRGLASDAFVCGLLHDVGKIALQACLPKSYARVVQLVNAKRRCINDVERDVLGLDHTVAGKRLAARWGLPQAIIDAIWLHHQDPDALPASVQNRKLVAIVHAADALVRRTGIGFSGYQPCEDIEASSGLELGPEDFGAVAASLPKRMAPLVETLGLDAEVSLDESLQIVAERLAQHNAELSEQNRTLSIPAALFGVVQRFTQAATGVRDAVQVCEAAAEALRAGLPVRAACVALSRGDALPPAIAWSAIPGESSPQASDGLSATFSALCEAASSATALRPAPLAAGPLWRECLREAPPSTLWMLRLGPEPLGVVLFDADTAAIAPFIDAVGEMAALARTFTLALSAAVDTSRAEHMTDELLDVNRRLRDAQAGLVRMRSMSMITEMAGGAAHEMNNPLAVISGRAQMELATAESAERRKAMETIVEQTKKAAQIVLELMQFAKPDPPKPVQQSLGGAIEACFQHWQASLGERSERLSAQVLDENAVIYADAAHVMEILNRVVENAAWATDGNGGRIAVHSRSRSSDEAVRIVVEDGGVGMTPQVLEHALDPFYSHRPAGRGRGLGLSRAYRLAEVNGGRLLLQSTPNVGTTVTIALPSRAPIA